MKKPDDEFEDEFEEEETEEETEVEESEIEDDDEEAEESEIEDEDEDEETEEETDAEESELEDDDTEVEETQVENVNTKEKKEAHELNQKEAHPVAKENEKKAPQPQDIPLNIVIEVGRIQMPIKTLMDLKPGNLLNLNVHPENGIDLVVNGCRIGRGELLQIGETLGIRILELG